MRYEILVHRSFFLSAQEGALDLLRELKNFNMTLKLLQVRTVELLTLVGV